MKKRIFFRSGSLKLFQWGIIPVLLLACTCAKSVQNNDKRTVDTLIITRTDTVMRDVLRHVHENTKERVRTSDSTAWKVQHDTVIKEVWHREVIETIREVQVKDSTQTENKSRDGTYKVREVEIKQEKEKKKHDESLLYLTIFLLTTATVCIVVYYENGKKSKR